MAETAPTIAALDYFNAAAQFKVQSSETRQRKTFVPIFDASGNYSCSEEFDDGDEYMSDYRYCGGGSPDIDTHLGTLATTFGQVADSKVPTEMRVHFEAGEAAGLTIDGHQHDDNPHTSLREADASGIIPADAGVGVPELIAVTGTVSPVSADLTYTMEHVDKAGADGTHFHGQNMRCRVSLTVNYEGLVTAATPGNWLNILITSSNPNDDTPTSVVTCEQFVDVDDPA
jgi:hypothetical protein